MHSMHRLNVTCSCVGARDIHYWDTRMHIHANFIGAKTQWYAWLKKMNNRSQNWLTSQVPMQSFFYLQNQRQTTDLNMSLTHDLPDRDGLAERGGRAASSDVDSHHSEQHLLPHWETLHPVLVLRHRFLISLHPVITWGTSQIRRRGGTVKRAVGPSKP